MKPVKNIPRANHLMGSMGYTFESAIADIIDNSISANCCEILLQFPKDALHCFVSILDDGYGMSPDELFNAMSYGSSVSEEERLVTDLGRFGLGLKAAFLSKCRKLTVISKQNDMISGYILMYGNFRLSYQRRLPKQVHILRERRWNVRTMGSIINN